MDPLDVLLAAMRRRLAEGDEAGAVALAKAAAPYVHPRAAVRGVARGFMGLERVEDADLDASDDDGTRDATGDGTGDGTGGGAGVAGADTDEPD